MASVTCGVVIFLYVHIALGHKGHDHSSFVEPLFIKHEIVTDVVDVAPKNELIVNKYSFILFYKYITVLL